MARPARAARSRHGRRERRRRAARRRRGGTAAARRAAAARAEATPVAAATGAGNAGRGGTGGGGDGGRGGNNAAGNAGRGGTTGTAGTGGATTANAMMNFFVTSDTSATANLGGLTGADARCQRLAAAVGHGSKTWRAYLSVATPATNARDRIGDGPYYNSQGMMLAATKDALHARSGDPMLFIDELGRRINGQWQGSPTPNQHDILTGSTAHRNVDGGEHLRRLDGDRHQFAGRPLRRPRPEHELGGPLQPMGRRPHGNVQQHGARRRRRQALLFRR